MVLMCGLPMVSRSLIITPCVVRRREWRGQELISNTISIKRFNLVCRLCELSSHEIGLFE